MIFISIFALGNENQSSLKQNNESFYSISDWTLSRGFARSL